ncbi:unnamed protein product [Arctia plantaginis]|uniref:Uncharacterized protein n=1 Tax=Arctia plantaginis TaxID=874455 RepID=A0A8S1AQ25_ARCPL|nr:unnamed protein product [Arctia plantaginis]
MLSFLKYTKPFKTSTVPSNVPRASDDTASKQDTAPLITSVVEKNNVTTESTTVTETNNGTDKSLTTIVLTTITHNISENDIYVSGNKKNTTISKYWNKNYTTLAFN